jgi:hypothetical protein
MFRHFKGKKQTVEYDIPVKNVSITIEFVCNKNKMIIDLGDDLCEKTSPKSIIILILLHTNSIVIETFSSEIRCSVVH